MAKVKKFKNTFCNTDKEYMKEYITIGQVMWELIQGRCKYQDLPEEIKQAVDMEDIAAKNDIKNTFAPNWDREYLSINSIIGGMKVGKIDGSKIPDDIWKRVEARLDEKYGKIERPRKIEV